MRPSVLRTCAMLLLVLAGASPARAQLTEAQPGTRVRVQAPGIVAGRYIGTVLVREPNMMRLGAPNAAPIDVPIDRMTSLEISRGASRLAGAGRGAGWGLAIGFGLGVIAAATSSEESRTYYNGGIVRIDTVSRAEVVAWSGVAGVVWGAVIGALFPKEKWERFDLASRTGFDERRRMQLGFRVAY